LVCNGGPAPGSDVIIGVKWRPLLSVTHEPGAIAGGEFVVEFDASPGAGDSRPAQTWKWSAAANKAGVSVVA